MIRARFCGCCVVLHHPASGQGCQICLGPNIPQRVKYAKCPQPIPNGHMCIGKLFEMVIKCNKIFHSKALQNIHKLGFLACKNTIWHFCSWWTFFDYIAASGDQGLVELKSGTKVVRPSDQTNRIHAIRAVRSSQHAYKQ
jgi:hypothetical protein